MVASGRYPTKYAHCEHYLSQNRHLTSLYSGPPNLVPCSDMAGEVMSVGEDVKEWKAGDRVCANFATGHLYGDPTVATMETGLGGQAHGVLTEYRTFPANVCTFTLTVLIEPLTWS